MKQLYKFECPTPGLGLFLEGDLISFESDFGVDPKGIFLTTNENIAIAIRKSKYFADGVIKEVDLNRQPTKTGTRTKTGTQPAANAAGTGTAGTAGTGTATQPEANAPGTVAKPSANAEGTGAVYEEVTRLQDAASILKSKHGVTSSPKRKTEVLAAAEAVGVSFPNLK